MTLWGIDISNHQAGADLAKAKSAGCSFVFAKATEGATFVDRYFTGFRAQATRLGMPLGAYHFARPQPGRSGAQEAAVFLRAVGDVKARELPCVLDLEDTKLSPTATTAWALQWLTAVHKATGVRPILYTYSAFAAAHLHPDKALAAYPLWLANYRSLASPPVAPAPWKSWAIWQHTSSAKVPGIPGNCDRNTTSLTTAQLLELGGASTTPPLEDDMTPDETQKAVLYADVVPAAMLGGNGKVTPITALRFSLEWSLAARNASQESLAIVKAMALKGSALTQAELDQIAQASAAGTKAALDELIDSATATTTVTLTTNQES